jgi:hypothetical protein
MRRKYAGGIHAEIRVCMSETVVLAYREAHLLIHLGLERSHVLHHVLGHEVHLVHRDPDASPCDALHDPPFTDVLSWLKIQSDLPKVIDVKS